MRENDIPICDVCEKREATSVEDGIYRCEPCETAHQELNAREAAADDDEPADDGGVVADYDAA